MSPSELAAKAEKLARNRAPKISTTNITRKSKKQHMGRQKREYPGEGIRIKMRRENRGTPLAKKKIEKK